MSRRRPTAAPRTGARLAVVHLVIGAIALGLLAAPPVVDPVDLAPAQAVDIDLGPRQAVPQVPCQPGDAPETDLQGRVPPADIASGRAARGYSCNLEVVGRFPSTAFISLDSYEDCAYYGREAGFGGTQVLDVSDPATPLPTAVLGTPAMLDPWESLRVHAGRGLLVADSDRSGFLDIYDIAEDCRTPRLLSSTDMAPAQGHEGWFSPDGMTYHMSRTGADGTETAFPIDISDPTAPVLLASWAFAAQTHGGSTTEDGTRSYICQQTTPPNDALLIVDTSEVASRTPDPTPEVLASIPLEDNQWCQSAYRVTYDGRPHLIQYGERSGAPDCSRVDLGWASFGYPRIYDIGDERAPVQVSSALLEVHLPEHCATVMGEGSPVSSFGYSVHHCTPDRLYDPTILACAWFGAGLRVLDIRDPANPVELAYYNPGQNGPAGTAARPVIRAERGEIWFVHDVMGFHVLRFADGVWPFEASPPCPEFVDHTFAHYNPDSECPTASTEGIGRPAPSGRVPLPRDRQRLAPPGPGDPVAQAVDTSRRLFGDGEASRVVLATSDRFPDALSGAALAGDEGPILLTPSGEVLDPRVGEEIARVTGGEGVVLTLGGEAAVSPQAAAAARAAGGDRACGAPLPAGCRFAGTGREHTAALVADVVVAEHPDALPMALLARGDDPTDALTGGAFAAAAGVPLLLTPSDLAHPITADWLSRHPALRLIALGGPTAIEEATLAAMPAGQGRERVAGGDRVATSVAIARQLWGEELGAGLGGSLLVNVRASDAWQTALTAAVASARLDLPQLGVEAPPAGLHPDALAHLATSSGPVMVAGARSLVSDDQLVEAAAARG